MVGGKVLFSNSTHLKANANKHKFTRVEVQVETRVGLGVDDFSSIFNESNLVMNLRKKTK